MAQVWRISVRSGLVRTPTVATRAAELLSERVPCPRPGELQLVDGQWHTPWSRGELDMYILCESLNEAAAFRSREETRFFSNPPQVYGVGPCAIAVLLKFRGLVSPTGFSTTPPRPYKRSTELSEMCRVRDGNTSGDPTCRGHRFRLCNS